MDTDRLDNMSEFSHVTNGSERYRNNRRRSRDKARKHRNRGNKSVTINSPLDGKHGHNGRDSSYTINVMEDETNTFISGETDLTQLSQESLAKLTKERESVIGFHDCGYIGTVIFACLSYLTPIAFVVLPKIAWIEEVSGCGTSCKGSLISMAFKLILLLVASWAIFFRSQRTSMPRVFLFRSGIMLLVILLTLTFWLFYGIWIYEEIEKNYDSIVVYADKFTNLLLFVHYTSLVLLELRHLQSRFLLEVIRTTDGERRFYNVGDLSIQRCSVWVLERYYCDFPIYNPALVRTPARKSRMNNPSFQIFDVDGGGGGGGGGQQGNESIGQQRIAMMSAIARRRDAGHNDRYYEEAEYERRVKKRKARLMAATEDAFTHIRRASEEEIMAKKKSLMDPKGASESVFPALARALQKYLRTTRQHQHYQVDDIFKHLAFCISQDMSPKAFLEKYFKPGPYLTYDTNTNSTHWELVSDDPLVNSIKDGTVFRLNQSNYSLVVVVRESPRLRLQELFVDPSSNRFTMHMQSETSV